MEGQAGLFLGLGALTPIDMRDDLGGYPALALLAGRGTARLWRRGGLLRLTAWASWRGRPGSGLAQWVRPLH